MAKITHNPITAGYTSAANMEATFVLYDAEFQNKVLYRNNPGGEPNDMQNLLDMNSNRIINLADGVDPQDAVTVSQLSGGVGGGGTQARETVVASGDGQTVFTLISITYTPGDNALMVFANGVYQPLPTYTETNTTTITLSEGINTGDALDVHRVA